jgi:hypothetical protein
MEFQDVTKYRVCFQWLSGLRCSAANVTYLTAHVPASTMGNVTYRSDPDRFAFCNCILRIVSGGESGVRLPNQCVCAMISGPYDGSLPGSRGLTEIYPFWGGGKSSSIRRLLRLKRKRCSDIIRPKCQATDMSRKKPRPKARPVDRRRLSCDHFNLPQLLSLGKYSLLDGSFRIRYSS